MNSLQKTSTDDEFIEHVNRWVKLLESEDYQSAFSMFETSESWTPNLLKDVIKTYGDEDPDQKVTLLAAPTDIEQRKNVDRWENPTNGRFGAIWYDLGINGLVSDLTATFDILERDGGLVIALDDVHVM